jgi:excisionase family DNA binding protein
MIDKLAFSPDEAASLASVGRTFIFSEIKNRRLEAVKAGSRTLITRDAITAWLKSLPQRGSEADMRRLTPISATAKK